MLQNATKERPILFSAPMVRAILDGRKTQTRRVIKPDLAGGFDEPRGKSDVEDGYPFVEIEGESISAKKLCPFGQPGDRLWVRETWRLHHTEILKSVVCYYADHASGADNLLKWKPSIHMPRLASRITLEITDVRIERLKEITEKDAIAEGWQKRPDISSDPRVHKDAARDWFMDLWESINGVGAWTKNPWVWVIEFKKI